MKKAFLIGFWICFCFAVAHAQVVYVDSKTGEDKNPGTKELPVFSIQKAAAMLQSKDHPISIMKINPGIYILDHHVSVTKGKGTTDQRIVIEASVLPEDASWTPDKMPVITCRAPKGEIPDSPHFVVGFLVNESHVTIRGIKFHGYFYPHTRYFPIARFDKTKTDLSVEQCLFVGEANISQIQAGVIAHGNEVSIDHCIFFKIRNTVVFFLDSGNGIKHGNGLTNSIIYGSGHAVWTVSPDKDFHFANNIVSNCSYVWVKRKENLTKYSMDNCVVTNNRHYTGIPDNIRLKPEEFEIHENNVTKTGEVTLRMTGCDDMPFLDEVDKPLPIDYLHVIPQTLGYELGAGLFKNKK